MGFWDMLSEDMFADFPPREVTADILKTELEGLIEAHHASAEYAHSHLDDTGEGEDDSARIYQAGYYSGAASAAESVYLYFFGGAEMLKLMKEIEKKLDERHKDEQP